MVERSGVCYRAHPIPLPQLNLVQGSLASPGELSALLDEVDQSHAAARSRWELVAEGGPVLAALRARGYEEPVRYEVLGREVAALDARAEDGVVARCATDPASVRAYADLICASRGHAPFPADRPWELILGERSPHRLFLVEEEGRAVAAGAILLDLARGVGFLWGGGTIPEARGRGSYRAALQARLALARELGLRALFIYGRSDTTAPMLRRHGFRALGEVWLVERPPRAP